MNAAHSAPPHLEFMFFMLEVWMRRQCVSR